jgi:hypothetical protein
MVSSMVAGTKLHALHNAKVQSHPEQSPNIVFFKLIMQKRAWNGCENY